MNGNQLIPVLSEALNALALVYKNVVSHQKKRKTLMHFSVFLIAGEKISILTQVISYKEVDYDDFERVHYFSTAGLLQWKGLKKLPPKIRQGGHRKSFNSCFCSQDLLELLRQ